jgi:hypothetical protein
MELVALMDDKYSFRVWTEIFTAKNYFEQPVRRYKHNIKVDFKEMGFEYIRAFKYVKFLLCNGVEPMTPEITLEIIWPEDDYLS